MKNITILIFLFGMALAPLAYSAADSIIVDNEGSNFSSTGKWNNSTRDKPFHGKGYIWAAKSSGSTATWTPTLISEGVYEVFVWFCASMDKDRASNAKYIIYHGGGKEEITLNQKPSANLNNKWHKLGEFNFAPKDAKEKRNVTLDNNGATHSVSADAMMWVLKIKKDETVNIPKTAIESTVSTLQANFSPLENGFYYSWPPEISPQEIKLYSIPSGKLIKSWYQPGSAIQWQGNLSNGTPAPNGVYFILMETAGFLKWNKLFVKK